MLALEVSAAISISFAARWSKARSNFRIAELAYSLSGILFDHHAQRLQRLEGQPLVAADVVDLVVVGKRHEVLGIGRILVARVEVDVALAAARASSYFLALCRLKACMISARRAYSV